MNSQLQGTLETILVVDHHDLVLKTVVEALKGANFRVLWADSIANAIKIAEETNRKIDMLLSDVEMPIMSGPDLGQFLKKSRPYIHVMLMSGGGARGNLLVLNYGWAYIQKPFVGSKLIEMVTEVLHTKDRSQIGGQQFDCREEPRK